MWGLLSHLCVTEAVLAFTIRARRGLVPEYFMCLFVCNREGNHWPGGCLSLDVSEEWSTNEPVESSELLSSRLNASTAPGIIMLCSLVCSHLSVFSEEEKLDFYSALKSSKRVLVDQISKNLCCLRVALLGFFLSARRQRKAAPWGLLHGQSPGLLQPLFKGEWRGDSGVLSESGGS